ncbi:2-oxoglutarate dehydrogenase E1 subunit family protein, partial [Rhodothermus marinus]|uniref:2-oxoglutarate dehydrogenase E1 subunit family protein n=1 Tax=Rhodothermus marinus TaxID=29549 RepID=UPI001FB1DC6C
MSTLGFNTGYVEELYRQYLENPESVSESWREFFCRLQAGRIVRRRPGNDPGAGRGACGGGASGRGWRRPG